MVTAWVVLAATGMEWRRLEFEGIDALLGHGVYYGVGRSEAARSAGEHVVLVGAGNSAGQAVLNFANAGARVTMLACGDRLGTRMSAYLVERIERHARIDVRLGTLLTGLHERGGRLSGVSVTDAAGTARTESADAVFICIGGRPYTDWCPAERVLTDAAGFILTGQDLLAGGSRRRAGPWITIRFRWRPAAPGSRSRRRPPRLHQACRRRGRGGRHGRRLAFRRLAELGVTV